MYIALFKSTSDGLLLCAILKAAVINFDWLVPMIWLMVLLLKPCKTLFKNMLLVWKMYNVIKTREKLNEINLAQFRC
jgi:hypothetical protein